MIDVVLAVGLMCGLAAGLFALAVHLDRHCSKWLGNGLAVGALLSIFVYALYVQDGLALGRLLPVTNLIILGNWLPLAVGTIAGVAWNRFTMPPVRRALSVFLPVVVSLWAVYGFLLDPIPSCGNVWRDGVNIQTTDVTCSPASAATLLRSYGIAASEEEMAELCLTTRRGTYLHGIYRGLKIKTAGTEWDVELFGASIDELKRMNAPAILTLHVEGESEGTQRTGFLGTWEMGQAHSVVLMEIAPNDYAVVGDPEVGRQLWTCDELKGMVGAEGIRLVRRKE